MYEQNAWKMRQNLPNGQLEQQGDVRPLLTKGLNCALYIGKGTIILN